MHTKYQDLILSFSIFNKYQVLPHVTCELLFVTRKNATLFHGTLYKLCDILTEIHEL